MTETEMEVQLTALVEVSRDMDLMISIRQSILKLNDAIERKAGISPTTAELRREAKDRRFNERKQRSFHNAD